MKLIEMRCPNCDAPLSVNADRDEAFCHHCNTMFLIEDAPKAESRNRPDADGRSEAGRRKPEELPAEETVEFETAKSESLETGRFAGVVTVALNTKPDAHPVKKETNSKVSSETPTRETPATEKPAVLHGPSEGEPERRPIAIAIAVVAFLLIAIMASVGTCGTRDSRGNASPSAHEVSEHAGSSSTTETVISSMSAASSEDEAAEHISEPTAATQVSSGSATSTSDGSSSSKAKDGFSCDLDGTATFSGVTIPIDSSWEDNSTDWDWRHKTFSYTVESTTMGDVQISISTFLGGDTKNAIPFMQDYADFGPIFLDCGEYTAISEDVRDGVTYTRVEGVDSHYVNSFSCNPPSKYETIREANAGDVVRCVCLVGYAEDGTGFAVAVALCGSADNDECLYSANKILDGVTFVPTECNIDSNDLWLYEVQH